MIRLIGIKCKERKWNDNKKKTRTKRKPQRFSFTAFGKCMTWSTWLEALAAAFTVMNWPFHKWKEYFQCLIFFFFQKATSAVLSEQDLTIHFPFWFFFSRSLDQDNYQNLFGWLDNCFLVAYAIGMFFRYKNWPVQLCSFFWFTSVQWSRNFLLTLTAAFSASGCPCVTTSPLGCFSAAFSQHSLAWASTGTFTPCGTTA